MCDVGIPYSRGLGRRVDDELEVRFIIVSRRQPISRRYGIAVVIESVLDNASECSRKLAFEAKTTWCSSIHRISCCCPAQYRAEAARRSPRRSDSALLLPSQHSGKLVESERCARCRRRPLMPHVEVACRT